LATYSNHARSKKEEAECIMDMKLTISGVWGYQLCVFWISPNLAKWLMDYSHLSNITKLRGKKILDHPFLSELLESWAQYRVAMVTEGPGSSWVFYDIVTAAQRQQQAVLHGVHRLLCATIVLMERNNYTRKAPARTAVTSPPPFLWLRTPYVVGKQRTEGPQGNMSTCPSLVQRFALWVPTSVRTGNRSIECAVILFFSLVGLLHVFFFWFFSIFSGFQGLGLLGVWRTWRKRDEPMGVILLCHVQSSGLLLASVVATVGEFLL
jgi:hypothetical protein